MNCCIATRTQGSCRLGPRIIDPALSNVADFIVQSCRRVGHDVLEKTETYQINNSRMTKFAESLHQQGNKLFRLAACSLQEQ